MAISKKLEEIMENKALAEEIDALSTHEEAVAYFAAKGVDIDAEFAANATGELDEESLEDVAGGVVVAIVAGWVVGRTVGIAARRTYDQIKYGDKNRTYTGYGLFGK